jgi:SpoVK/Ycf46/Vps4 family AAA+-type ATPase
MTDLLSPEVGVTEKRLHSIFERAARNTPALIFFDEIDAVAGKRSGAEGTTERRLINQFLVEMDGFEKKEGVVVLAATNAPWDIDPALRRAGRFSDQIFLPPPDSKSRQDIFRIHLKKLPVGDDVDFETLSALTDGFSSADLKLLCDEAAKIPWKESMASGKKRPLAMSDFQSVLAVRQSSLTPWFSQAEKQLKASGEEGNYPELMAAIGSFSSRSQAPQSTPLVAEFLDVKRQVEFMLQEIRQKHKDGQVDDETLRTLVTEYQGKIIEIEAKVRLLQQKKGD